jgi:hypothetical protein
MVLLFFLAMCESIICSLVLVALGPALLETGPLVAYMTLFSLQLLLVIIVPFRMLYTRADNRTHTLVDSYKEHFLTEYGVELSYSKLTTHDGDVPGIYLRRPHTSREEKDFGDSFPPIFIDRTIPGDVDLFRMANLDLTEADAKACSLLWSTYWEEVRIQPFPGMFYFLALALVSITLMLSTTLFEVLSWDTMVLVCFYASFFFTPTLLMVLRVIHQADLENRNAARAASQCQEVARLVTEALQIDKDIAGTLSVEFSTSQLPGRDKQQCRRFQFVRHGTAPSTRNEMTDVSGSV